MPPATNMTLLQLEPDNTLYFCKTPMTTSPHKILKLTNLHSGNVAFKVKTTAPKAYLVRPSSGTLRKGEHQEVQIILQPTGTDAGQPNNHRFLVQAVPVSSNEAVNRDQWAEFTKEAIQELRLNVVLEEKEGEPQAGNKPTESYTNAPAALAATTPGQEQPGDLKVKYDELVQYTLMLEKEKKKLEADMASLKDQKGAPAAEGFSKAQVILVAILAFLLSYLAKFM
uniref:MSP domain-containing protein n=1 Tax=Alexandrium andersonii TaxID=327968 RepID=A0A7S2MM68_9DINO|mmetsp:Transcript_71715/g.160571  ORF Transcript_71715/g.160571 Transcript_71715/m.160571 type:complete len:226 (+) Transcript_71715:79-756(+)